MMARVVVIEDDRAMQYVLTRVFRGKAEVLLYGTIAAAAAREDEHRDAMIVDHRLPDGDGLAYARAMTLSFPAIPIILFTASEWSEVGDGANESGIIFANKPDGIAHIHRLVARMEALRERRAPATKSERTRRLEARSELWRLSKRELEAARLAVEGLKRGAMASRLRITAPSVKKLVTRLLKKCDFASLDQLVSSLDRPVRSSRRRS